MKKSTPTPLRDLCLSHFKILRIPILPNDLDAVLDRADKESLSHLKFLDLLLGQQAAARPRPRRQRRVVVGNPITGCRCERNSLSGFCTLRVTLANRLELKDGLPVEFRK